MNSFSLQVAILAGGVGAVAYWHELALYGGAVMFVHLCIKEGLRRL